MPTVHQILKESGLSDAEIAALDQKAIGAFSGVMTAAETERTTAQKAQEESARLAQVAAEAQKAAETASQAAAAAREKAELEYRSNVEFYDTKIAPALTGWEAEKQKLETARINAAAEAAFYKTQNEAAKAGGFVPQEAPAFNPPVEAPRDGQGKYVAGAPGGTPGSPVFDPGVIDQRIGSGLSNMGWAMQEYQKLTGQFLPDPIDQLATEATNMKLPFRDYVARKYDFEGKKQALTLKAQQEHDDKIRQEVLAPMQAQIDAEKKATAEAVAANDRKWAEKIGSNPEIRIAQPSRFADVARAQKAGERPDPLVLNEAQRRAATSSAIRSEIAEASVA